MSRRWSRRNLLVVAGAALAAPALTLVRPAPLWRWRGIALGAMAEMRLAAGSREEAEALAARCAAEVRRLEAIFSLYRPDSALRRLNREGVLADPPFELLELLAVSRRLWRASGGAFDPSVQPLWRARTRGGDAVDALARVGFDAVRFNREEVRFERPGMALTFNGIAQGYITDRVVELLRRAGLGHALVELGETRALGRTPDGRAWRVLLEGGGRLPLAGGALAVSAGGASPLPDGGHHLIDPMTGASADHYTALAVRAPNATLADGLSTAASLLAPPAAAALVAAHPGAAAYRIDPAGRITPLA